MDHTLIKVFRIEDRPVKCGLPMDISVKREEDHSHCDNCIKILKCRFKNNRDAGCPIIACDQGCGFKFHRCKNDEHRLLCMNEKTRCINHNFGCPTWLLRQDLAEHISRCPASVIHCYIEWNRWPIYTRDRKLTQPIVSHSLDTQHLDVALTLRDQRMLEELWTATRKTRCTLRNSLTRKYPAVPLKPYCGTHITDIRENGNPNGSSTSSIITPQTVSDDDSDSSPWQMNKSPPGLQSSVCARLNGLPQRDGSSLHALKNCDNNNSESNSETISHKNGLIPTPPILPNSTSLSLDLNLNAIAPFQAKPKLMYTFRCAQEFRRDEYGSHYQNFHGDILGSINGWMEHRCPLWQYGCNFVQRRIHPHPVGTRITFNSIVESFGHVMNPNCDMEKKSNDNLLNLPYEVLRQICSSLDGFSLNNLSMTCIRMREICSTLLENRGVVILQWERRSSPDSVYRWVVGSKKWAFSTNFTEVKSWYFDQKHEVLNHIKNCPHYEIIRRTEPIALPAMKNEEIRKRAV